MVTKGIQHYLSISNHSLQYLGRLSNTSLQIWSAKGGRGTPKNSQQSENRAFANNQHFRPLWTIFSPLWSIFRLVWSLMSAFRSPFSPFLVRNFFSPFWRIYPMIIFMDGLQRGWWGYPLAEIICKVVLTSSLSLFFMQLMYLVLVQLCLACQERVEMIISQFLEHFLQRIMIASLAFRAFALLSLQHSITDNGTHK